MDRETAKHHFLSNAGWADATIAPLAGDASNRRYDRVEGPKGSAVLMDAPPSRGERIIPFVEIAEHLTRLGLHPPAIMARDVDQGFLLIEDLGDALFARVFETEPDKQIPYYTEALAVLRKLHDAPPPRMPEYGLREMTEAAGLAAIWYAGAPDAAAQITAPMAEALERLDWSRKVPVLRDYHAENLLWCAQAEGLARVGLLDFQDAGLGHPVYDVASLLVDARRDVPSDVVDALKDETWAWFSASRAEFDLAFAVLTTQRALRILGVFARLSLHFNKPAYVDLIPRVWGQLEHHVAHPELGRVAEAVARTLPAPSQTRLDDLKARAGTCPTL